MPRSGVTLSRPCKTIQVLERQRRQVGSAKALGSKVKGKVAQLRLTLFNPVNHVVLGVLQAGILEWVTFPSSTGSSQPRVRTQVSHIAGGFFTS